MEKPNIGVSDVPNIEFPGGDTNNPTKDKEKKRYDRFAFRNEVAKKYVQGGILSKGTRLVSGGSKKPERPNFQNINPDLGQEITIRAHRMTDKDTDIPEGYRPITKRV